MNLWIRSQDKKGLVKVNDLYIVHDENNFCDYIGNSLVGHLAKYNKENRALEILDEIQDLLKSKALIKTVDNNPPIGDLVYNLKEQIEIIPLSNNIVYEMPKE